MSGSQNNYIYKIFPKNPKGRKNTFPHFLFDLGNSEVLDMLFVLEIIELDWRRK